MTTAATVVGHFPLVLATGPGAGARNSIGIMLVSGMIIGTVFTLFVVPSIYMLRGAHASRATWPRRRRVEPIAAALAERRRQHETRHSLDRSRLPSRADRASRRLQLGDAGTSAPTRRPLSADARRRGAPRRREQSDLAIVRLGTEVEAARVGESRERVRAGVLDDARPLEQRRRRRRTSCSASAASTSTTGSRRPASGSGCRGASGTWSVSWDTSRTDDEQPDQQLRSQPAVGLPVRVLAAAAARIARSIAARQQYIDREAQSGELGAALPRVGRPDRRRGQAGVLDAEGDARQRRRAAALARARAGARAAEQGPRRCRPDSAARSGAGGSRSRAAAREPDSRATPRPRTPRIALRRLIMDPADAVVLAACASIRSRSRRPRRRCPTSTRPSRRRSTSATTSRARGHELENATTNVEFLNNQRLPDVRLETSYRGSGLGGTQFLRTGGFPGIDHRHARPRLRRRARPGVHQRLSDVERRRHRELSARPQLRRGQPRARARSSGGRRRSASRACSFEAAETRPPGRRGRCAARPSASTRRAPARRWRSSASTSEQRRFEVGLSTTFLVTQAQRDLLQAQVNLLQTTLDYESALVNFEARAAGARARRQPADRADGDRTSFSWGRVRRRDCSAPARHRILISEQEIRRLGAFFRKEFLLVPLISCLVL